MTSSQTAGPSRRLRAVGEVLLSGAAMWLYGCRKPAPPPPPPPPPEVTVVKVEPRTVPIEYNAIGRTEASRTVEIRARVQGFIERRAYEEGGRVDEGTLLYQIDPRSFKAELDVAKANLERAKATLANDERQVARLRELAVQQAASPKELDDMETSELQSHAQVRLYEAEVATAELDLSYTTVISPLRGRAGLAMKREGALVDSGANSLLTTVMQDDPIDVLFSIAERDYLKWKGEVGAGTIVAPDPEGRHIQLIFLDGTVYPTLGKLDFFDITVNVTTGTILARAKFENPDGKILPGQFVRAKILGWERPGTIAVPQRAVLQSPNGQYVFVVDAQSKAEVRPIQTGDWQGEGDWIVEKGLKAGELVIVDGVVRLRPGTPVRVGGEPKAEAPGTPADGSPTNHD